MHHGVTILGPDNLPVDRAVYHASQMYAKNVASLLAHLVKEGKLQFDMEDEITRETLVVRDGEIVHPKVREALGAQRGGGSLITPRYVRRQDGSRAAASYISASTFRRPCAVTWRAITLGCGCCQRLLGSFDPSR